MDEKRMEKLTDEQRQILSDEHIRMFDSYNGRFYYHTGMATEISGLIEELAIALLERNAAREVLKGMEWMDAGTDDEDKWCPECGNWKWRGHYDHCKLDKNLPEKIADG
jgi:hypothetical protein